MRSHVLSTLWLLFYSPTSFKIRLITEYEVATSFLWDYTEMILKGEGCENQFQAGVHHASHEQI